MRIVDTDNFGGDYPNEKFLNLPAMTAEHAQAVCDVINGGWPQDFPRFYKVVPNDYKLQPGFEP